METNHRQLVTVRDSIRCQWQCHGIMHHGPGIHPALSSPLAYDDPQAAWSSTELVLAVALLANQTLYIILGDIVKHHRKSRW
jgi:hypothetical protein